MVPIVLLAVSTLAMVHFDPTIFLRSPRSMMHLISGLFTEQTTQLMLDHMVGEKFQLSGRWCLIPPMFLVALTAVGMPVSVEVADAILLVYTCGLWLYLSFRICVQLYEICDV